MRYYTNVGLSISIVCLFPNEQCCRMAGSANHRPLFSCYVISWSNIISVNEYDRSHRRLKNTHQWETRAQKRWEDSLDIIQVTIYRRLRIGRDRPIQSIRYIVTCTSIRVLMSKLSGGPTLWWLMLIEMLTRDLLSVNDDLWPAKDFTLMPVNCAQWSMMGENDFRQLPWQPCRVADRVSCLPPQLEVSVCIQIMYSLFKDDSS